MTTRADSYSSTGEIIAFTKHLLNGQTSYNSTTNPTLTEVERFIDRASGVLNLSLAMSGLATPITNSTAKLVCDDWVTDRVTEYVELTQRGVGYSEGEGSRVTSFRNMAKSADEFARINQLGFVRLGVSQIARVSDGLAFTGIIADEDRDDPNDTSLQQPLFHLGQFDGVDDDD